MVEPLSKRLPARQALRMPIHVPMTVARSVAVPMSSTVGHTRSAMTEYTGWRNCSDSRSGVSGLAR